MKKNNIVKSLILMLVIGMVALSGCSYAGYDFVDTNYHFDYAYIKMPNGEVIEGYIQMWADSNDGEQLTITFENGNRYLVNSVNCVLVEYLQKNRREQNEYVN